MKQRIIKRVKLRHRVAGGLADLTHSYFDGGGEYIEDTTTKQWWWDDGQGSSYSGDQWTWSGTDADGNYHWGYVIQGLPPGVPNPNSKPKATNWTPYLVVGGVALLAVTLFSGKRK